jgi:hypothetical protein
LLCNHLDFLSRIGITFHSVSGDRAGLYRGSAAGTRLICAALTMSQLRDYMKPQAAPASLIKRGVNITVRIGIRHARWRRDLVL